MTKQQFKILLEAASFQAIKFAQTFVRDNLNASVCYDLAFNDNDAIVSTGLSEEAVVDRLYDNGRIPVWVDICVEHIRAGKTVLSLVASDQFTDMDDRLYYRDRGIGPFGVKSPSLRQSNTRSNPDSCEKFWLKKPWLYIIASHFCNVLKTLRNFFCR